MIPVVDYRFGDKYYVTEFVRPYTFMVKCISKTLKGKNDVETVINVARFIRDEFYYPLDIFKNPSCDAMFLKSRKFCYSWHFKKYVNYLWLFPSECLLMKFGICIDTSLLCTSILRCLGFFSYVGLGAVYYKDKLLGYHAWTEVYIPSKADWYIIETTIHEKNVSNILRREEAYKGSYDIQYEIFARFNEKEYEEVKPILTWIQFYGKKWKKVRAKERNKQIVIWSTFKQISPLIGV